MHASYFCDVIILTPPKINVMQGYFVRSTKITPSIYFNPKIKVLDIRGKSIPENPLTFYNHIQESLNEYRSTSHRDITVSLALKYFNTSSSKCIYMLFKKLDHMRESGEKVIINWYYESSNQDMLETGEDLMSFFNLEFNIIEIPEITALGVEKQWAEQNVLA